MRFSHFLPFFVFEGGANAIRITKEQELAQTGGLFTKIFDLAEMWLDHAVPIRQDRVAQIHGNRFHVVDKNDSKAECGNTWGQSVEAKGKDKKLMQVVGDLRSPGNNN